MTTYPADPNRPIPSHLLPPPKTATLWGFLCGCLLFLWVAPMLLIIGILRLKKAEAIGLAFRDLYIAVAR